MPKKKSEKKLASDASNTEVQCGLCCKPVVEDRDEALLCEGSCNAWLHRYCAGVTVSHYAALQDSPLPFLCTMCSQVKQAAIIKEMQEKIDSLTAEVTELRSNANDLRTALDSATYVGRESTGATSQNAAWTDVVRRGKKAANNASHQATGRTEVRNVKPQRELSKQSVTGARRIWGTLKTTTVRAVEKVISGLAKVPTTEFKVKRKYKISNDSSDATTKKRVTRWWFVIRAEESVLDQLHKDWHLVSVQTDWKLTPLLQYVNPNQLQNPAAESSKRNTPSPTINEAADPVEQAAPGVQQSTHVINDKSTRTPGNNIQQSSQLDNLQTINGAVSMHSSQTETRGASQSETQQASQTLGASQTEQSNTADPVSEVIANGPSALSNESIFLDK
jgi:hypothetical protein